MLNAFFIIFSDLSGSPSQFKDDFSQFNWMIIGGGLVIYLIGFLLIKMVGQTPESWIGFLAPFTIILGLFLVIVGMLVKPKEDS